MGSMGWGLQPAAPMPKSVQLTGWRRRRWSLVATCAAGKSAGQRVLAEEWGDKKTTRFTAFFSYDPTKTKSPLSRALVLHAAKKRWLPTAAHWSRAANSYTGTEIILTLALVFTHGHAQSNINREIVRRL